MIEQSMTSLFYLAVQARVVPSRRSEASTSYKVRGTLQIMLH